MTEETEDVTKDEGPRRVFNYPDNFLDSGLPNGVISPSGFGTYKRCPRQFEFIYVKGMRRAPGFAALKGSAIHRGAEVVHKHTIETGKRLPMEAAVQEVSDEFDDGLDNVEKDPEVNVGELKDRTIANFRTYYTQAVPLIRPVAAEKTFAVKIGTVPMRGIIDLIDNIPGDVVLGEDDPDNPPLIEVVSDLKTTTKKWSDQMVDFSVQLTIYSIAENTSRVRVDLLVDQKSGTKYIPIRSTRTSLEKKNIVEDVEEMAYLVKKGVFPRCLPDFWGCTPKSCGFYAECRGPR